VRLWNPLALCGLVCTLAVAHHSPQIDASHCPFSLAHQAACQGGDGAQARRSFHLLADEPLYKLLKTGACNDLHRDRLPDLQTFALPAALR